MQPDGAHIECVSYGAGDLSCGTTERRERELPRVTAMLQSQLTPGVRNLLDRDPEPAFRERLERGVTEQVIVFEPQRFDSSCRCLSLEWRITMFAENGRQKLWR